MDKQACAKCGAKLQSYWLKDGVCNGCRNPHLIVEAKPYVSSIVNNYGDTDNVKRDAKTIREIQSRQGSSFLIDCIAESCGETANKFKMSDTDRMNLVSSLVAELRAALLERL